RPAPPNSAGHQPSVPYRYLMPYYVITDQSMMSDNPFQVIEADSPKEALAAYDARRDTETPGLVAEVQLAVNRHPAEYVSPPAPAWDEWDQRPEAPANVSAR